MVNELIKLADELDKRGLHKEADHIDQVIQKEAVVNPVKWWKEKGFTEGITEFNEEAGETMEAGLDWFQVIMDGIGLVPGGGEPFDLANAGISILRDKPIPAIFSAIATIPTVGDVIGKGSKLLFHTMEQGLKAIKLGSRTYTVQGLAAFLLDKIRKYQTEIKAALNWLDKKVGTRELSRLWNKTLMPQIVTASKQA